MLNILNLTTGLTMLVSDVDTWMDAHYWLDYYRNTYGPDKHYVNEGTKHFYTGEFVICHLCDCGCGQYYIVQ